jgi:hypothetical protein
MTAVELVTYHIPVVGYIVVCSVFYEQGFGALIAAVLWLGPLHPPPPRSNPDHVDSCFFPR